MKTNQEKFYIGLDVHDEITTYAVKSSERGVVLSGECATGFEDLSNILEPYLPNSKICLEPNPSSYLTYLGFKGEGYDVSLARRVRLDDVSVAKRVRGYDVYPAKRIRFVRR